MLMEIIRPEGIGPQFGRGIKENPGALWKQGAPGFTQLLELIATKLILFNFCDLWYPE